MRAISRKRDDQVRVSVIVPCRNEEHYIAECLDSILATSYPHELLEVLVVDGNSDDKTREIADSYAALHPNLRVINNPRRIVSTALNIGIAEATGEVILRMDAHAHYPTDYIPVLVEALVESGADNVGVCVETLPANNSPMARAIAIALSHPLGVGNSSFRVGASESRWVDTVPFGCFRRDVFDRIGTFDEDLIRNQDDEFNHRLLKSGGRILLLSGTSAAYYARRNYSQLARMYYQYGFFKPLAALRAGGIMTIRQLIPAAFVSGIVTLGVVALMWPAAALLWLAIAVVYLSALLVAAIAVARKNDMRCGAAIMPAFAVLHFAYGLGYLRGLRHAWRPIAGTSGSTEAAMRMSR